jgi:hypothetical protein
MLDHVEPVPRAVGIADEVGPDVENAPFEHALGGEYLRTVVHMILYMPQPRSSILVEIGWLAYFLAVFVAMVYLMVLFVVPHHFNDKIAITLAGFVAGIAMITTRAWWTARHR